MCPVTSFQLPTERRKQVDQLKEAVGASTLRSAIGVLLALARDRGLVDH
jgi:hypothetical protein